MVRADQLAAAREIERERAAREKYVALNGMAEKIEASTGVALKEMASRTTSMAATAGEMHASASRTGVSANTATAAAGQALANAQIVARAAEQLSGSIREISGQVDQSSAVVARAVEAGTETRKTIQALNEQVGKIGLVADMIRDIAGKTNLLALNATIEAARAGPPAKASPWLRAR